MKIPGSQMLVNPVRTNETVSGAVNTPNFSQNLGIETKFAEMIEQNAYKYQELRDNEQILGSESFILEGTQDTQSFQLGLKTDDSYYKDSQKFTEFSDRFKNRKEMYLKMAKENGYKPEIIEAAISRMDREFEETKAIYGKYSLDYLKEKNKKADYLMADERAKTMSQIYLNGNYEKGNMQYKENGNALWKMYQKENLTPEQFSSRINKNKQEGIYSQVMSFVNVPGGEEILNEMAGFGPQEFQKYFSPLQQKFGDYDVVLDSDDFDLFKRAISSGLSTINTRKKAQEQETLYDVAEAEKKLRDEPVDNALKLFPADVKLNENFVEFALAATNYKNGTNFKSLEEMSDNNVAPVTIQGKNDRSALYMDENISATEFMQERLREVNNMVGGRSVFEQTITIDNQYNNGKANYIMGYNGTILYAKGDTNFRYLYDNLYTAENKKILSKIGDVEGDYLSAFKMYEDDFQPITNTRHNFNTMLPGQMSGNPYKDDQGIYKRSGKYTETSLGGKLIGLRLAGMNGDKHAERTARDCEQLIKDTTLTLIMTENAGLLSEDLAKELELETYVNQPIEALNVTQKKKIINAYLEDPGRLSRLFGGENPVKKQVRERLTLALTEMTAEFQTVDIGNGRFLNIRPDLNGGDVAKGINSVLQRQDFYNKNGLIVPGKQIKVVGKTGSDDVLLFYNGEPLFDKAGNRAYINIGGVINE